MTVYDEALEFIKAGQSVVIDGVQYTLKNIQDLPKLEEMVAGDAKAEKDAFEALKKEKEELEKRIAKLEAKETKVVAPKEAKEKAEKEAVKE
jgi:cell division protein FtsB